MRRSPLRKRYGHANPRPKSHGFILVDTRTGELVHPALFKRREAARDMLRGIVDAKGNLSAQPGFVEYRGGVWYRPLGVHQVMLYPGETYSPETYKP